MEAEKLLEEVQGEMPIAGTRVVAVDMRRSSRAIASEEVSTHLGGDLGGGREGKAALKIDRGAIF